MWLCRKLPAGNGQRMLQDSGESEGERERGIGLRGRPMTSRAASDSISTWVNITVPDAPLKFKRAIHFHLIFNAALAFPVCVFPIAFPLRRFVFLSQVLCTDFCDFFCHFLSGHYTVFTCGLVERGSTGWTVVLERWKINLSADVDRVFYYYISYCPPTWHWMLKYF